MRNAWFETVAEAQRRAKKRLPRSVYAALLAGSEKGLTVQDNVEAFDALAFARHVAGLHAKRQLSTTVMGQQIAFPVIISPTGVQAVHPDGEIAVARAAAARGTAIGLSSFASKPIEDAVAANAQTFFQMYWVGTREQMLARMEWLLHHAEFGERLAEGGAVGRTFQCDVLCPAGHAQPSHAVRHPGRAESDLRVLEAFIDFAQYLVVDDLAAVEHDLAVPAEQALVKGLDVPDNFHPRVPGVNEEHRRAAGVPRRATGTGHANGEAGAVGSTDEPLAAVDAPPAGDPGRRRGKGAGVGARARSWLRHREAGSNLAGSQWAQVTLLLIVGRDPLKQVHVALVGRRAVERERTE
jgi:hypothetical protein